MKTILIAYKRENSYINELMLSLEQQGYSLIIVDNLEEFLATIRNNARLASVLLTYDIFQDDLHLTDKIIELNEELPIFLLKQKLLVKSKKPFDNISVILFHLLQKHYSNMLMKINIHSAHQDTWGGLHF